MHGTLEYNRCRRPSTNITLLLPIERLHRTEDFQFHVVHHDDDFNHQ